MTKLPNETKHLLTFTFGYILIYNSLVRLGCQNKLFCQLFCYQIISTLGLSIQSLERVKFISSTKHMVALKNAYL